MMATSPSSDNAADSSPQRSENHRENSLNVSPSSSPPKKDDSSPPRNVITPAHSSLYHTLNRELHNLGKALTCALCLSTYQDPVLLPCVHSYCRNCIVRALETTKSCPTCKQPAHKRSLMESQQLASLGKAYKETLRALAFVPLKFTPQLVGHLTQLPPEDDTSSVEDQSQEGLDNDDDNEERVELHYQMSKTWQRVQAQEEESDTTRYALHKHERDLVVQAATEQQQSKKRTIVKEGTTTATQLSQLLQESRDREVADRSAELMLEEEEEEERRRRQEEERQQEQKEQAAMRREDDLSMSSQALLSDDDGEQEDDQVPETNEAVLHQVDQFLGETQRAAVNTALPLNEVVVNTTDTATANEKMPDKEVTVPASIAEDVADDETTAEGDEMPPVEKEAKIAAAEDAEAANIMTMIASAARDKSPSKGPGEESQMTTGTMMTAVEESQPTTVAVKKNHGPKKDATTAEQPHSTTSKEEQPERTERASTSSQVSSLAFFTADEATTNGNATVEDTNTEASTSQPPPQSSNEAPQLSASATVSSSVLPVGTVVQVQSRTWPGVNKPGGVARIQKVHSGDSGSRFTYDVVYVLGGREKQVEATFVSKFQEVDGSDNQPTATTTESEKRERSSRRVRVKQEESVPATLLKKLASDGFDATIDVAQALTSSEEQTPQVENKASRRRRPLGNHVPARSSNASPAASAGRKRKTKESLSQEETKRKGATETKPEKRRKKESTKKKSITSKKINAVVPPSFEFPVLENTEMCSLADELYKTRFQTAEENQVISVVCSSLPENDKAMLHVLCKESRALGVKVKMTETLNPSKTTMCLMPIDTHSQADPNNPASRTRTLKAMRAAANGIPLVSSAWIYECQREKKVLMPKSGMYIRTIPSKAAEAADKSHFGVALCAARMQQQASNTIPAVVPVRPLGNMFFLLCGQFSPAEGSPKKTNLQLLIREAGGSVLTSVGATISKLKALSSSNSDPSKVVLLCDECDKDEGCGISTNLLTQIKTSLDSRPQHVLTVASGWLFDSISCGTAAPTKPYKPRSQRAMELWGLSASSR